MATVALVLLGNVHTVEDFIETLLLGVSLAVAAVPEAPAEPATASPLRTMLLSV